MSEAFQILLGVIAIGIVLGELVVVALAALLILDYYRGPR